MLIGNLTSDPEMRYTPQGTAVCTFGVATNSSWTSSTGEKKENVEFHNIVAWNKLAETCAKFLKKGGKVFVEGRLSTQSWQGADGIKKQRTEIVINDLVMLDKKSDSSGENIEIPDAQVESQVSPDEIPEKPVKKGKKVEPASVEEDIPF